MCGFHHASFPPRHLESVIDLAHVMLTMLENIGYYGEVIHPFASNFAALDAKCESGVF